MTRKADPNERKWFIAYVKSNQERKTAEVLEKMGKEHYLPIQREIHRWSDRNRIVERLVIPRMIFIRCTEHERVEILASVWQIFAFMSNGGRYNATVVRDAEMETFRAMVEHSGRNVSMSSEPLAVGDHVRITSGPLTGYECELVSIGASRCLAVRLGAIGTATMDLELDTVERIEPKQ